MTWQNLDGRNQSFREENVFDDRIWGEVRFEW
jgi:hypothetical protein